MSEEGVCHLTQSVYNAYVKESKRIISQSNEKLFYKQLSLGEAAVFLWQEGERVITKRKHFNECLKQSANRRERGHIYAAHNLPD